MQNHLCDCRPGSPPEPLLLLPGPPPDCHPAGPNGGPSSQWNQTGSGSEQRAPAADRSSAPAPLSGLPGPRPAASQQSPSASQLLPAVPAARPVLHSSGIAQALLIQTRPKKVGTSRMPV